jgi:hypothetical protein
MGNIFLTFNSVNGITGGFATLQRGLQRWWHQLPVAVRARVWPGILATLVIVGMLLAFHQVVRAAVQQSELRHKAIAMQAEATWRCNAMSGLDASKSCLLQLNSVARSDPVLEVQDKPWVHQSSVQYALESPLYQ